MKEPVDVVWSMTTSDPATFQFKPNSQKLFKLGLLFLILWQSNKLFINPILDGGGGQICPPSGFFNIAQKPLGLGS